MLDTPRSATIRAIVEDPTADLLVPALCDAEVVSALRRLVLRRTITVDLARAAIDDYVDLPIERVAHEPLLRRVLDLRDNFGAFDALNVALAERHDATLVTADASLARAVMEHLRLPVIAP